MLKFGKKYKLELFCCYESSGIMQKAAPSDKMTRNEVLVNQINNVGLRIPQKNSRTNIRA